MGLVSGIYIAASAGAAMQRVTRIEAIPGQGLVGDRYFLGTGFYSATPTTAGAREVTLVRDEDLAAVEALLGIQINPGESRRNLTTRGVNLAALIGRRFAAGGVVLEGVRACPPCVHLEELTGKALLAPLARCGGLRARVVTGGAIQQNDAVVELGPAEGPTHGEGS